MIDATPESESVIQSVDTIEEAMEMYLEALRGTLRDRLGGTNANSGFMPIVERDVCPLRSKGYRPGCVC